MSDQIKLMLYLKNMISDLIYINTIMATELIKINENLVVLRQGEEFLQNSRCLEEHESLNRHIMKIVEKYNKNPEERERKEDLEKHVLKHLKE